MFSLKVRQTEEGGAPDELGYVAHVISVVKVEIKWGQNNSEELCDIRKYK